MADESTPVVDFDKSFDELTKLGDEPVIAPAEPTPEAPPVEGAAAEASATTETPDDDTPVGDAGDGEEPAAPAESEPGTAEGEGDKPADPDEDLLNRLGALLARTKAPDKAETRPEPAPAPAPATAQDEPELLTADELKLIEETEKDWPDVVRAVRLERNAAMKQAVDYVFKEVAKELRPWMETVKTLAQRTHLQELQSKVPDYDTVTDNVIGWVDKQPSYLQAAYKQVIQQGTADEVADLIERFKAESGRTAQAPAQPKKKAELPTATKQAAAALAPVSTKRTAPTGGGIDATDFDAAFAAFADKV